MKLLTERQRRRVEEMAQQEDLRCHHCGSSELVSEDRALVYMGGVYNAKVRLECQNERCYLPGGAMLYLSMDKARSIGIDVEAHGRSETL